MNSVESPPLQREHLCVADHARQEAERDLKSLKQPEIAGLVAGLLLILLSHLLTKGDSPRKKQ
jgi:hypothetical protein